MSATGIGASVRRKEDQRFVTGKGRYTADIDRPGQAYAAFVRSPHAHARIKAIDSKAATAMPGVLAVLTGTELVADKIGNLICGWLIHSKDGSPMKMAPHPALAHEKACHVGDPVAVVVAETLWQAKDAAEKVRCDFEVLPAVADVAKAQEKGAPQIHQVAPGNSIYQWHLGDAKAVEGAFKSAKHVTRLDIRWRRARPSANTMPAATASPCGTPRRTRMWRAWSSPPSWASRPSTNCA
jgi:carbon-monoxide dehydrogenase large subunit